MGHMLRRAPRFPLSPAAYFCFKFRYHDMRVGVSIYAVMGGLYMLFQPFSAKIYFLARFALLRAPLRRCDRFDRARDWRKAAGRRRSPQHGLRCRHRNIADDDMGMMRWF